jgi:hypothetical protein
MNALLTLRSRGTITNRGDSFATLEIDGPDHQMTQKLPHLRIQGPMHRPANLVWNNRTGSIYCAIYNL